MKTETRILAEKIQAKTGSTLISINSMAMRYLVAGLFDTRLEALSYVLELSEA